MRDRLDTLDTLVSDYRLDATGFDAAAGHLTDHGPLGNHLAIGGARTVPLYRAVDGHECMDFDGSWWFEGRSPLLGGGSLAMLFAGGADRADGLLYVLHTAARARMAGVGRDGSLAGVAPDQWYARATRRDGAYLYGAQVRCYANYRESPGFPNVGYVSRGPLHLLAASFMGASPHRRAAVDGGPVATGIDAADPAYAVPSGSHLRVGGLLPSGTIGSGFLAIKRLWFLRGDAFEHPGFAAARAAEVAAWGIG